MATANIHALLIGIDYYLPHRLSTGDYYPSLGGCVGDIAMVETFLRQELDVPADHIQKLTASLPTAGADEPPEPRAQWPTYKNLVAAFRHLTSVAAPGDQVYIHYSGHGGRVPTKVPALKGENGLDETLVPMDIGCAQHLRDVELVALLQEMVAKNLIVTLALDCCHAGGATRGLDEWADRATATACARGITSVDYTRRPDISLVASDQELLAAWQRATVPKRGLQLDDDWFWQPQGYVLLAACRPSESAYEDVFADGERHGALTYSLLQTLNQLGLGLTYQQIYPQLLTGIHRQFPRQTPMLLGEGDRLVFGIDRVDPIYSVLVLAAETAHVQLHVGAAQGIHEGAQFAIYPRGVSDFAQTHERLAVVEIDEVGATISTGRITAQTNAGAIERGCQAVLLTSARRRNVQTVITKNSEHEAIALRQLEEAIARHRNWLCVSEGGAPIHYRVTVNVQDEYEVRNQDGTIFTNLPPALKVGTPEAALQLVQWLEHLSRYYLVAEIADLDQMVCDNLIVELRSLNRAMDTRTELLNDFYAPGEKIELYLKNISAQVLNITVLDLQPDWGITQLIPYSAGAFFEPLEPGQEWKTRFTTALPSHLREGIDILKVFATKEPANFRCLELPPLSASRGRAMAHNERIRTALEELLALLSTGKKDRNLEPVAHHNEGWGTAQVILRVRR